MIVNESTLKHLISLAKYWFQPLKKEENIKQGEISIQKYFGHPIKHINFLLILIQDLIMRIGNS